mmetsp:Transcript_14665/g.20440  ORF Transcript_14665/g.20440 Transcript_14665/m.20440 type:complete len:90 (+) Transcript_14665:86-355(+)
MSRRFVQTAFDKLRTKSIGYSMPESDRVASTYLSSMKQEDPAASKIQRYYESQARKNFVASLLVARKRWRTYAEHVVPGILRELKRKSK